jgi:response regulator RpfG family c-di-GMP phosphodiesterase
MVSDAKKQLASIRESIPTMLQQNKPKEIIRTLLGTPLLRSILIVCLAVSILLPTYSTFFIMPHFVAQLMRNVESDAQRTAGHLASSLPHSTEPLSRQSVTNDFLSNLHRAIADFEIADIKIFSDKGEVIYSTRDKEIGTWNTRAYFWDTVAKGRIYSKVSSKAEQSAEGNVLTSDVAEVYAPLMAGDSFRGAFEIYYDVTKRKNILDRLLFRSSLILYSIAFLVLALSGIALWKASSAIIQRNQAELQLQEANQYLEARVADQTHEILVTQRISIEALASLAEFYDTDTGEHLLRIQEYTELLVSTLRENSAYSSYIESRPRYIADIQLASLLHDIGKTAIPKEILSKQGLLTPEEFEQVKQHTVIAGEVLLKANSIFVEIFGKDSYLALARDIATHHHERWDGKGYPHGLKGEDIPLSARIIALVDVYDALRSNRPYKEAWPHQAAVDNIVRERGTQFDPHIVDAFLVIEKKLQSISS